MIRGIGRESLRSGVVRQAYPSRFDLDSQTGAKYSHRSAKNYFSPITSHPTSPSGSTELAEVLPRGRPPHRSSVALCTSTSIVRYPASELYVGASSRLCATRGPPIRKSVCDNLAWRPRSLNLD